MVPLRPIYEELLQEDQLLKAVLAEAPQQIEGLRVGLKVKKQQSQYLRGDLEVVEIEQKLDHLLQNPICKHTCPKTNVFFKSKKEYWGFLLTFLYHEQINPDNNGLESAIRNFKVKLRVSGQFETGHDIYVKLRSVADTCIKRGGPVINAFLLLPNVDWYLGSYNFQGTKN